MRTLSVSDLELVLVEPLPGLVRVLLDRVHGGDADRAVAAGASRVLAEQGVEPPAESRLGRFHAWLLESAAPRRVSSDWAAS